MMLKRYCLVCGLAVGTFSVGAMVPGETNVHCGKLAVAVAQELRRELKREEMTRYAIGMLLEAAGALPESMGKKQRRKKIRNGYSYVCHHCPYFDCPFKTHYLGNVERHVSTVHKCEDRHTGSV